MLGEGILRCRLLRFKTMASPSKDNLDRKRDFSSEYTHVDCTRYYQELMKNGQLVERNEFIAKHCERNLLPIFEKWATALKKPLKFLDVLCCYGNDTLSYTNAYYQEDFAKTWASETTCYQLIKPRTFPVETVGVDVSASALEFGKKAGIFDEIIKVDLNALSESESHRLRTKCESANILHINSTTYLNEEVIHQIIDWFAAGKEPGLIAYPLVYPFEGRERKYRPDWFWGHLSVDEAELLLINRDNGLFLPDWFWGHLSVDEAELLLINIDNGLFLVRESASNPHTAFSLSFRCQMQTHHTRIEIKQGKSSTREHEI
ncbi:uncharacterized protein LOC134853508 [Symsagittifera roscoffensis]|uniref:uncharacterized protein LOC134853508 n=1 Tax=Symsagittifera roscoffensis TaxID=84072 RepID=UPI00307B534A